MRSPTLSVGVFGAAVQRLRQVKQATARTLAQQVLSQFDEATQAVAVGVLVDGLEHEEVAEMLGISRRTVARKLERFLDTARAYLSRS